MVLIYSKLIDAIICFNVYIEVFIRFYLMCEYEMKISSLIIILLTAIILLLFYLLTEKICLLGTDQANSIFLLDSKFLRFI